MNVQQSWKQRLKFYEAPPVATIFPFQRRHVIGNHLKLPELPAPAVRIMNGAPQPETAPPRPA